MEEISKNELRKIWVIYLLLNCEKKYQQDLIKELNKIAQKFLEKEIEYREIDLILEYDPDEAVDSRYYNGDEFDYEFFMDEKTYKISLEELTDSFEMGKEGDVSEVERILEEWEGIGPEELNGLDSDDWPMEVAHLIDLRELYLKKLKKITDPMVSIILKELREEGILETVAFKRGGRGPSPNQHYLKQDPDALSKILIKLLNPKLSLFSYSNFVAKMMSSVYLNNLINIDTVKTLENNLKISFNEEEREIILKIIKISPNALSKVLEYSQRKFFSGHLMLSLEESSYENKKFLLFELQFLLGEDIKRMSFVNSKIKYKITVSFEGEFTEEEEGKIFQNVKKNELNTTLFPISKEKGYNYLLYSDNSPL